MDGDSSGLTIMAWTILPAEATERAWLDESFRSSLLADAQSALAFLRHPPIVPVEVVEERPGAPVLPLPELPPETRDPGASVAELVQAEIGDDESFSLHLPWRVVSRALTDAAFRSRLLEDAGAAAAELGLEAPAGLRVLPNTGGRHLLVLPASPLDAGRPTAEDVQGWITAEFVPAGT